MNAREEAIDAVIEAWPTEFGYPTALAAQAVDAIPARVLRRLADERRRQEPNRR